MRYVDLRLLFFLASFSLDVLVRLPGSAPKRLWRPAIRWSEIPLFVCTNGTLAFFLLEKKLFPGCFWCSSGVLLWAKPKKRA